MPACVCIASTSRSRWSQLSLTPLLLPLRRFLGQSRAHYRLSWDERLARNARETQAERITLTLFGIPDRVAAFLGLTTASSPPGGRDPSQSLSLPNPWADFDRFWWFCTKAVACQTALEMRYVLP